MTKSVQRLLLFLIFIALTAMGAMGQTESTPHKPTPSKSQANTSHQALDLGVLDGTDYVNNSFRFSLSIPKEWVVATAQRRAEFDQQLKKMVNAPDQKQLDRVQDSLDGSKTLLRITKLPEGQPNNAQFVLIAERLASPSLKTGLDVIEGMRQAMKGTNFVVEIHGRSSGRDLKHGKVWSCRCEGDFIIRRLQAEILCNGAG